MSVRVNVRVVGVPLPVKSIDTEYVLVFEKVTEDVPWRRTASIRAFSMYEASCRTEFCTRKAERDDLTWTSANAEMTPMSARTITSSTMLAPLSGRRFSAVGVSM